LVQDISVGTGKVCSLKCFDGVTNVLQALKDIAPSGFTTDPATTFRNDIYLWTKPGTEVRDLDMTPGSLDHQKAFFFYEASNTAMGYYDSMELV